MTAPRVRKRSILAVAPGLPLAVGSRKLGRTPGFKWRVFVTG